MFVVLYQDRHLVVLDKPPGLPVIPGRDGGDSVVGRSGWLVCHRLDTDTSGVLVMARTTAGQRIVNEAFAARKVEKSYRAVCVGSPPAAEGLVDLPLGEWQRGRVQIGRGKAAQTRWKVVGAAGGRVWVDAEPLTGRTHQVRAHLASIGLPILGDEAYGGPPAERIHLHARRLGLPWPRRGDRLLVEAPLPPGFSPESTG